MCGIVGIYDPSGNAGVLAIEGGNRLQHRGQDGAGLAVSTLTEQGWVFVKGSGMVNDVFRDRIIPRGKIALVHTRYGTQNASAAKVDNDRDAAPLELSVNGVVRGAYAHNGDLVGAMPILERDYNGRRMTRVDSELFGLRFADSQEEELEDRVRDALLPVYQGAYALVGAFDQQLFAVRDPFGFRPLVYAQGTGGEVIVASESHACSNNGWYDIADVPPGFFLGFNSGFLTAELFPSQRRAHCYFEWDYKARPESIIDSAGVSEVRQALGKIVAQQITVTARPDVVISVPDSGNEFGHALADCLGVPVMPWLLRGHYVGRVFITEGDRRKKTRDKLSLIGRNVQGKHVLLADDSIIRGTTMIELVAACRDAGAREVDIAVSSPLWSHPCHMGINTKSREELLGFLADGSLALA